MTDRAAKSGLALEAQRKVHGKYDSELAGQLLDWIASTTNLDFNKCGHLENFCEVLKDGLVLCRFKLYFHFIFINAVVVPSVLYSKHSLFLFFQAALTMGIREWLEGRNIELMPVEM